MRHAEAFSLQRAGSLCFQRKCYWPAQINLLRGLSGEMDSAEPMRQGPRYRQGRPRIGINPPMHAIQLPLTYLAANRLFA